MLKRDAGEPRSPHLAPAKPAAAYRKRPNLTRESYQEFTKTRRELLQTTSKLRLQSRAVDFRRVWWDRGMRGASREGMSLWRPSPPVGYIALGKLSIYQALPVPPLLFEIQANGTLLMCTERTQTSQYAGSELEAKCRRLLCVWL